VGRAFPGLRTRAVGFFEVDDVVDRVVLFGYAIGRAFGCALVLKLVGMIRSQGLLRVG
jgi:hypothetical protein